MSDLLGTLCGVSVLASAVAAGGLALFVALFPRVSALECGAMAAGLGLSASAWAALLLRSALAAVGLARAGLPAEIIALLLLAQLAAVRALWPAAAARAAAHGARLRAEVRANAPALAMLAAMAVWWSWTSYYHYLYSRGSDYMAGGSASRRARARARSCGAQTTALRAAALSPHPAARPPPLAQARTRTCPST